MFSFDFYIAAFLANTSSIIIAVSSLTLHYYLLEEPITLSCLFASLALFNQLTVPLFIFPVMLPIIVSAIVSSFTSQISVIMIAKADAKQVFGAIDAL